MNPLDRAIRMLVLASAMVPLTAYAGAHPKPAAPAQAQAKASVVKPDDRYGHRFYMTQKGKRMTADDFDAWLKAKGLQIKGGKAVAITPKGAKGAKGAAAGSTGKTGSAMTAQAGKSTKAGKNAKQKKATTVATAVTPKDG